MVGPEQPAELCSFWQKQALPFLGLPDPEHRVLRLYGQPWKLFRLGRLPAQVVIDPDGLIGALRYGRSMADIPEVAATLAEIEALQKA